jgi:hypothetical protein
MTTLADVTPREFLQGEYNDTPAYGMRGERVVKSHNSGWPGKQKNVNVWWDLMNGYAVGWNENPSRGWSFPVVRRI